jgi:PAS domain S-box-containing protein
MKSETHLENGQSWFRAHYIGLSIPTFLWKYNCGDFVLIDFNKAAYEITNGGIAGFVGIKASEMYSDQPKIIQELEKCYAEKIVIGREINYHYRTTGQDKILTTIYVFLYPDYIVVHTEDITESKIAAQNLLESEQKYKTLVEMMPHAVCIFQDGTMVFANQITASIFRCESVDKLDGTIILQTIINGETSDIESYLSSHLSDNRGISKFDRISMMRYDGETFTAEIFVTQINYRGRAAFQVMITDITEREKHEKSLFDKETKLSLHLRQTMLGVIEWDPNFIIREWNPAAEKIFGYSREEAIGRHPKDLIIPREIVNDINTLFNTLMNHEGGLYNTNKNITKNGDIILCEWFNTPVFDNDGNLIGAISLVQDITERKLAEELLQKSREAYRDLVENVNDVIFTVDLNELITYVSPACENALGYHPSELLGLSIAEIIYKDDLAFVRHEFQEVVKNNLYPGEYRIVDKNGEIRWVRTSSRPIIENGRVTGIRGVLVDITDRKRTEDALFESEKHHRSLFEESPVSIWEEDFSAVKKYLDLLKKQGVTDLELYLQEHPETMTSCTQLIEILDVNQAALDLHQIESKKGLFKHLRDTFTPDSYNAFAKELHAIWNGLKRVEMDAQVQTLDRKIRYVHVRWSVAQGHEQTYSRVLVSLVDITDHTLMEESLRESEQKYRLLIENAGEIIVNVNYDGLILLINRSAAKALGGMPKDYENKTLWDVFPKELADGLVSNIRKVIDSGNALNSERAMAFFIGEKWLRSHLAPVTNRDGIITSVLILSTDITSQRKGEVQNAARLELLQHLRKAGNIDECLTIGCQAIYNARIFQRSVLTLHDENKVILNLGQVGLDNKLVADARQAPAPSNDIIKKIMQDRFRISNSFLIPTEAEIFTEKIERQIIQKEATETGSAAWVAGDELFVPLIGNDGKYEGWLSVDTPFSGRRPAIDEVQYLEEILDIVAKQVHEIQTLKKLKEESQARYEKYVALREVLSTIEEEKMEIKQKIAANVAQILIPALNKLIKKDGSINRTYYNILKSGLPDIVSVSGAVIQMYSKLSPRQREICNMIKSGATTKEIADTLNISLATVQKHRELIRQKLGITNKDINLMIYLNGN